MSQLLTNEMFGDLMTSPLLSHQAGMAGEVSGFVGDAIGKGDRVERLDLATLAYRSDDVALIEGSAVAGAVTSAARRMLDIVSAICLLLLTLPVMVVAALAVKIESPGALIYRQERVGLGGTSFTILKFRSMRADAERSGAMFAQQNDPRVTRVGRIIRKLRIDELPQLFNVLRGEMSMVGPRPERPGFVARYEQTIPFYGLRTLVKPGVTGWAQVKAPYSASDEETKDKLAFDLYYMMHRSLKLDVKVMLATVRVILFRIGAR